MKNLISVPKIILGLALAVILSLIGCNSLGHQSPRYIKLAHQITERTAKELKEQKNLYLIGTGGQMMDDVQMMMMAFQFFEPVSIEKARELLIYSVEKYTTAINSNKEIQPYLHTRPFTDKNVEIVIYFSNPNGSDVSPGNIVVAAANEGDVVYYDKNPERKTLEEVQRETYEGALRLACPQ